METDAVTPSDPVSDVLDASDSMTSEKAELEKQAPKDGSAKKELSDKSGAQDDEDRNPIKRSAKQTMKDVGSEIADFYDPNEDDENEIWMQKQHTRTTGMESKNCGKRSKAAY
ncbi:hypothetical protein KIN20_023046 [Parelaphostrongylus tenuis]|uniref:Uncharacterized protein n=1 Tax=Parelaphostrongylus tenuis TaxID=148309 RepID=A0AAD5N8L7_PARTN|nr:hypothetical protein KIN20_023046 [Parelaphostrongylus tenuis]